MDQNVVKKSQVLRNNLQFGFSALKTIVQGQYGQLDSSDLGDRFSCDRVFLFSTTFYNIQVPNISQLTLFDAFQSVVLGNLLEHVAQE